MDKLEIITWFLGKFWKYGNIKCSSDLITHLYLIVWEKIEPNVPSEPVRGDKQDYGVDEELWVDEHVTHHDQQGGEKPAVKSNHQHCGDV